MKDCLKLGLYCRKDCVGAAVRSCARLMLVSRPIQRDPGAIAGIAIKEIEHRVADRGFRHHAGCVARGFSCSEADDDGWPAHGESRTTETAVAFSDPPSFQLAGLVAEESLAPSLVHGQADCAQRCRRTL